MKVKYEYVTGETIAIEVPENIENVLIEVDRDARNSNRRENRRHNSIEELQEQGTYLPDKRADIPALIEQQELRKSLHNALKQLLPQQRDLITNVFFEGKSIAEIARFEGVDERAIRNRLNKIYKKLKRLLQP